MVSKVLLLLRPFEMVKLVETMLSVVSQPTSGVGGDTPVMLNLFYVSLPGPIPVTKSSLVLYGYSLISPKI